MTTSSKLCTLLHRSCLIGMTIFLINGCVISPKNQISKPIPTEVGVFGPTEKLCSSVAIHDLQGAGHRSPYVSEWVDGVCGIVTAYRADGFYIQEPLPDTDDATSEGIFVFTLSLPNIEIGDQVLLSGRVDEEIPGGAGSGNLAITRILSSEYRILSSGNVLPDPTIIGTGGRIPPEQVDSDGLELFSPDQDAIDFYESMEGMIVRIPNAVAVGPTSEYKELPVIPDIGEANQSLTSRGGVAIRSGDFNPERLILDDALRPIPNAAVGDTFAEDVIGIVDYSFGNYKIQVTHKPVIVPSGLTEEIVTPAEKGQLTIAVYNVENLSAESPSSRFEQIALDIVKNLNSPDILSLVEVQDNDGAFDSQTVSADQTLNELVAAIVDAGGPLYSFRQIDPEDDRDGGEPGGNIRVVIMFRTDVDLNFVDRPGGDATTQTFAIPTSEGVHLSASPGRIEPQSTAFINSRKPLVAEFLYHDEPLFVVVAHLNSKGEDQPLFGRYQPPRLKSEAQRSHQAEVIAGFVQSLLAVQPDASLVLMGDLNDFYFSNPLAILTNAGLTNLIEMLPVNERYTYIFEGNSQALDHIFVSEHLKQKVILVDVIHINSEWPASVQVSDHDPVLARFDIFP